MGNWFCFRFWFCFRLLLAIIAHFNWFGAIYINCIYFTLWKSYDILWFWTHLALCACFPALRPENYLLVFIRIIRAKRGEYSDKTYKEIYELLFKNKTGETNAEKELKRVETIRKERRQRRQQGAEKGKNGMEESTTGSEDEEEGGMGAGGSGGIYPKLANRNEEQAMPNIRIDRTKPGKGGAEGEGLINFAEPKRIRASNEQGEGQSKWRKMIPAFFQRNSGRTESERRAIREKEAEKKQIKREEQAQKLLEKRERKEKRRRELAQLRERARVERSRKNFADSVDLLLTYCRLITSFAILVGNIHRTFLPRYLASPLENVYDNPDMLMIFTVTLLLDVGFFWLLVLWSFCQQLGLCWRLGICRFLLWCSSLLFFGGICMLYPMHFVHQQLAETWCEFDEGEPLSEYFDGR